MGPGAARQRRREPAADQVGAGIATKKVDFSNDLFAEEALSFIDQSKNRPFFLYLALTSPHANNEAKAVDVPDQRDYAKETWPEQEKNMLPKDASTARIAAIPMRCGGRREY